MTEELFPRRTLLRVVCLSQSYLLFELHEGYSEYGCKVERGLRRIWRSGVKDEEEEDNIYSHINPKVGNSQSRLAVVALREVSFVGVAHWPVWKDCLWKEMITGAFIIRVSSCLTLCHMQTRQRKFPLGMLLFNKTYFFRNQNVPFILTGVSELSISDRHNTFFLDFENSSNYNGSEIFAEWTICLQLSFGWQNMKIRLLSVYFLYYFVVALKPFIASFWWRKLSSNDDLLWSHKCIGACRDKLAICLIEYRAMKTCGWQEVLSSKHNENCTELEFSLCHYVDDIHVDSTLFCTSIKIIVIHKGSEQVCTMACTWNYSHCHL